MERGSEEEERLAGGGELMKRQRVSDTEGGATEEGAWSLCSSLDSPEEPEDAGAGEISPAWATETEAS